jgi:hypothetical protein
MTDQPNTTPAAADQALADLNQAWAYFTPLPSAEDRTVAYEHTLQAA